VNKYTIFGSTVDALDHLLGFLIYLFVEAFFMQIGETGSANGVY